MEKRDKSTLPIIGTDEFHLTHQDVLSCVADAKSELNKFRELLADSDEKIQKAASRAIPFYERSLVVLTSVSPDEILVKARSLYDNTLALAEAGLGREDIAAQIADEFPDAEDLYLLLRKQSWGYHLGQALDALRFRRS